MNGVDIGVLVVVALCAVGGYRRGLIYSAYKLLSLVIALFLALFLYSPIANFIRQTIVYDWLKGAIARGMGLEGLLETAARRGISLIDALPLPSIVQDLLHVNNNDRMFELLRVSTIEGFVAGFFANMVIMALALVFVFIIVMVVLSVVGGLVEFVGELPIIRTINGIGGFAVGALFGVVFAGLLLFLANLFFSTGASPFVMDLLQSSMFGRWTMETLVPNFFGASV